MKRAAILCALLLGACNHTQPAIEVRTVEVPVPVACVDEPTLVKAESGKPADDVTLTGDANRDLPKVAERALRWKAYATDLFAIVSGCAVVR